MVDDGAYATRSYSCEILYVEIAFETTVAASVTDSIIETRVRGCVGRVCGEGEGSGGGCERV